MAVDALLSRAASAWAAQLAASGVLGHRGNDGMSALDRYRALGGTEVRVGEILGAGPTLGDIEKAWMKSPEHRALALGSSWTHVGWGSAVSDREQVWVVQFTEKLVDGLSIEQGPQGTTVSGRFLTSSAETCLLYTEAWRRAPLTRGTCRAGGSRSRFPGLPVQATSVWASCRDPAYSL